MRSTRRPLVVLAAATAAWLVAAPPAYADATAYLSCTKGQSGWADFRANATETWTYWGRWQNGNGAYSNSPQQQTSVASGTTYRITSVYDSKWALREIHVRGNATFTGATGCVSAGTTNCTGCPEIPGVGPVTLPPLPVG